MRFSEYINGITYFVPNPGKRDGSVVESQTTEREVAGIKTYLRRIVSLRKTFYSLKVLQEKQEAVAPSQHD